MASRSSGVMAAAARYMVWRQVQKLSCPSPDRSVSPAAARWWAWLCRLGMPGMAAPGRRSVKGGQGPPTLMSMMTPSSTAMTTSSAQPSGRRAVVKWKWRMGQGVRW